MPKKHNPQDTTLRNVRAANAKIDKLKLEVRLLKRNLDTAVRSHNKLSLEVLGMRKILTRLINETH